MLSWPTVIEWERDNRWQPLETCPTDRPVDVYCHKYALRGHSIVDHTASRFHGARWDGQRWTGIREGYKPKLWAEPMSAARIRAFSI